jgi:hypothetical protein
MFNSRAGEGLPKSFFDIPATIPIIKTGSPSEGESSCNDSVKDAVRQGGSCAESELVNREKSIASLKS